MDPEAVQDRGESVKVVVRCRPLSDDELQNGNTDVVDVDEKNLRISVHTQSRQSLDTAFGNDASNRAFTYDAVFSQESTQVGTSLLVSLFLFRHQHVTSNFFPISSFIIFFFFSFFLLPSSFFLSLFPCLPETTLRRYCGRDCRFRSPRL